MDRGACHVVTESDMTELLSLSQGNFNEAKELLICEENMLANILITTPYLNT